MDIPNDAPQADDIPVDQFEAAPDQPHLAPPGSHPGDIPVDQFQAQQPQQLQPGDIPVDQFQTQDQAYGGAGQALKAAAEGAAKGVIGPVAPYLERMAGITAKTQRERAAAHPVASSIGEATGLGASMLTGVGEGALMTHAGELASKATGLADLTKGASYAARVGSSAVKQAAEMAILQGSDEVSKRMLQDPNMSAETALSNIGIASALGAGTGAFVTGAVSPLWKATIGNRLDSGLKTLVGKIGGIEGIASQSSHDLEAKAGVTIAPELKSVIDDIPGMKDAHSVLSQSDTTIAGRSYQKKLADLNEQLTNTVSSSLGHTPESIERLQDLDKYSRGREIGETLHSELKPITEEISNRYDKTTDKFKTALVGPAEQQGINEAISKLSLEKGWNKAESDTISNFADNVMEKIPKQETVEDLKKFMTNLRDAHPYGSPTYQAAKDIGKILKSSQEKIIGEHLGPEEVSAYNALKGDYSKLMDTFDGLNEHLHVGRYDGPQGFLNALKEKSGANGEQILDRTLGGKRADVLEQLKQFPQTLEKVKQYHIDNLIDKASTKTIEGTQLNVNNLLKNIDSLSPQVKSLVASPRQHQAIDAVQRISEALKDPKHNWSNTSRTAAKLAHGTPSALSLLAALTGHAEAGILTFLGKLGLNEGKDALKLGMMKFLSSAQPLDSNGFKAMVSYMDSAYKGETKTARAVERVLKPGFAVLASSQIPSAQEIAKLDRMVAQSKENPGEPMNSQVATYMPGHAQALAKATGQVLNHLQQLQPQPIKLGPLDKPMKPSVMEQARYDKALEIAINPLIVLKKCKDGTLQTTDIQDLKAMYPAAYTNMQNKLMVEIVNKQNDNSAIPYKTRLCISQFMQQPLDSSMVPNSIMAAQTTFAPKQASQQQSQGSTKRGTSTLGKSNNSYKTPNQAAESDRGKRE